MKKGLCLILLTLLLVTLAACVARPHGSGNSAGLEGRPAGFWLGLWHGFIAPFTLFVSLFDHTIGVFETHNNGLWYVFGFVFGLSVFLGGGNRAGKKSWRHKKMLVTALEEKNDN